METKAGSILIFFKFLFPHTTSWVVRGTFHELKQNCDIDF
jgi:hypothetical protein